MSFPCNEERGPIAEIESCDNPGVCARCAETGPTCCRLSPGDEEFCFPVSDLEWERILDYMGDKGGFVQQMNTQGFVSNLKRLFPMDHEVLDRLFPLHRPHLRLAITASGSCSFLEKDGCLLPREVRPYYCRLFPLWIYGERLTMFEPANCLATRRTRHPKQLMDLVGLSEEKTRTLHGQLRLAWGLPPEAGLDPIHASLLRGVR